MFFMVILLPLIHANHVFVVVIRLRLALQPHRPVSNVVRANTKMNL
jgi:hypothetical protein